MSHFVFPVIFHQVFHNKIDQYAATETQQESSGHYRNTNVIKVFVPGFHIERGIRRPQQRTNLITKQHKKRSRKYIGYETTTYGSHEIEI